MFIRLVFYSILFYVILLLYRFFKSIFRAPKTQSTTSRSSGTMVKDEYCNIYLPEEDAIRQVINGREYFFCSSECRQKFIETRKE